MRTPLTRIGLLAVTLAVVVCSGAGAIVQPDPGRPMAAKELWLPELDVAAVITPAARLDAARHQELASLGVPLSGAHLDERTGRWATLLPALPLLPGDGVGNSLSWADLGVAAPADRAGLEARADAALRGFLARHAEALRIPPGELGRSHVNVEDGQIRVHIPQVVDGVPVRDAYLVAAIGHGNLILLGTNDWGRVSIPTQPEIGAADARWAVVNHLSDLQVSGSWKAPELILLPTDLDAGGSAAMGHRLAWVVRPEIAGELGRWEGLVDAHSGELIGFYDTNHYAANTRVVVGGVYPKSNDGIGPEGTEQRGWPMPFADFGTMTTDEGGNLPMQAGGNLTTNLDGPFIRISDNCGGVAETAAQHLNMKTSGGDDCTTPPGTDSSGNTHSARSGFYELNRVAQWARDRSSVGWLSNKLTSNMNINSTCNAFWNGSTINFYRSGGGCGNTGELAGVFDHEWGHGLDDNDGGGISFPGEGIADVYAALRLDMSCIGRGFFDSGNCSGYGDPCIDCSGIRDVDWMMRQSMQPHDVNWALGACGSCGFFANVHCLGAVYSEAVWDLVKRDLPNVYGADSNQALELGTRMTLLGAPGVGDWFACTGNGQDGCHAASGYMQFLAADDDNGNVNDGTPHMRAIFSAYDRHGIACNTPAVQDSGCSDTPATAPQNVTVTPGDRQVTISWDMVPGTSKYQVWRAEGVTGCDMGKNLAGETTGTSLVDTGLLNNFDYYYTVIAVGSNDSCMGPASSCTTATPAAPAPGLSLSGGCPGGTLTTTGNAPNGPVGLARGSAGASELPGTGCANMPLNISGATLDQIGTADGAGTATFTVNNCGQSYVAVDYLNCASSNAVSVP